ncbi:maleylpyruvate isomerase family mycothiol-dependent enzyme [[Mycobacterium] nativiensis]|uniref:Maleylpyruvate isomerase family mycothiol-dependent enzyme n=1 Tax=[Mycobacterium] nativiensis TaxID=2855503 RepID=A0ABU5XZ77_9MYCO|nr:maleylpyruvate isomerase family mycothiol-dependent enzyme [Mycolicibacter sp. MYC340]MEB3033299.1 maleylpyruvate isomerase family mycothiol-dependent enzyme [Mycolicibacter sp. MYC340]
MTRPTPQRAQTISQLLDEYQHFADLLSSIEVAAWNRATRCSKWQVCDVAGHVVGQAVETVNGTIGTRTPDQQAASLRHLPPSTLALQLLDARSKTAVLAATFDDSDWEKSSPLPYFTIGQGMHSLLADTFIHADDIRAALGRPSATGPALYTSIGFILGLHSRDKAALADQDVAPLLHLPPESIAEATGLDPHEFLLAATGRRDATSLGLPPCINVFRS